VKQSGVVLKHIRNAADAGVSVVFITHNPHHAYLVGDNFYLLNRGQMMAEYTKENVSREELVKAMAGGAELDAHAPSTLTNDVFTELGQPPAPSHARSTN